MQYANTALGCLQRLVNQISQGVPVAAEKKSSGLMHLVADWSQDPDPRWTWALGQHPCTLSRVCPQNRRL